jgi:hypothetical protein
MKVIVNFEHELTDKKFAPRTTVGYLALLYEFSDIGVLAVIDSPIEGIEPRLKILNYFGVFPAGIIRPGNKSNLWIFQKQLEKRMVRKGERR